MTFNHTLSLFGEDELPCAKAPDVKKPKENQMNTKPQNQQSDEGSGAPNEVPVLHDKVFDPQSPDPKKGELGLKTVMGVQRRQRISSGEETLSGEDYEAQLPRHEKAHNVPGFVIQAKEDSKPFTDVYRDKDDEPYKPKRDYLRYLGEVPRNENLLVFQWQAKALPNDGIIRWMQDNPHRVGNPNRWLMAYKRLKSMSRVEAPWELFERTDELFF